MSGGAHRTRESGDFGQAVRHGRRAAEPAKAVGYLARILFPQGVVPVPNALHGALLLEGGQVAFELLPEGSKAEARGMDIHWRELRREERGGTAVDPGISRVCISLNGSGRAPILN